MLSQNNSFHSIKLVFLALVLSEFPNIGKIRKLFFELKTSGSDEEIFKILGTKIKLHFWKQAEIELNLARQKGIEVFCIAEADYPEKLRHIPDPPLVIFVQGNLNVKNSVAIVGSRKCSQYGLNVARNTAKELCSSGISVVSGLAFGIDCAAHSGTLETKHYPGVAVLGSGLLHVAPKSNLEIAERLLEAGGALVSEYPLNTNAQSYFFPERNRIVSGLSDLVLIVEAAEKSGSLITARLALEQGREVFAVPGQITSSFSLGTNNLIREGAKIFSHTKDLLEFFPEIKQNKVYNNKNILKNLSAEQKQVYELISAEIEISKEDLAYKINFSTKLLTQIISQLELSGLINLNYNACLEINQKLTDPDF